MIYLPAFILAAGQLPDQGHLYPGLVAGKTRTILVGSKWIILGDLLALAFGLLQPRDGDAAADGSMGFGNGVFPPGFDMAWLGLDAFSAQYAADNLLGIIGECDIVKSPVDNMPLLKMCSAWPRLGTRRSTLVCRHKDDIVECERCFKAAIRIEREL